ncbi:MAG TPA: polyprenol monophosphomannose synthase [Candidatus Nanoarchaeia archaeon]|nr:polyprenol monophosphomannose synthase [Candidatus Nanoarchaeia archaeon]
MKPDISIILATYNERGNIELLIPKIQDALNRKNIEIIVVDDNSPDGTSKIVQNLQKRSKNIRLITRTSEKGLASALLAGFDAAKGDILIAMDSDLAHDPKYLPEMIHDVQKKSIDCIIGSRYLRKSRFIGKPFHKKLASMLGQKLFTSILGLPIRDTTNNFRVFKRSLYRDIRKSLHPQGNVMLAEFLYRAYKKGYIMKEIPILYIERRKGKTKLSLWKETLNFIRMIGVIKYGTKR